MADIESQPLLKGTVDLLVLKVLSWGPMHGFGISTRLQDISTGELVINDSAMYQVLHRLEAREFVEAEWAVTKNNRRARYYRLTPAGRRHLQTETENWLRSSSTVTSVLTRTARLAHG